MGRNARHHTPSPSPLHTSAIRKVELSRPMLNQSTTTKIPKPNHQLNPTQPNPSQPNPTQHNPTQRSQLWMLDNFGETVAITSSHHHITNGYHQIIIIYGYPGACLSSVDYQSSTPVVNHDWIFTYNGQVKQSSKQNIKLQSNYIQRYR